MAEPNLIELYRKALYVVRLDRGELVLRIGQPSPELDELLDGGAAATGAFVTASNPAPDVLTDVENESRQAALREAINAQGYMYYEGEGRSPAGDWQPEQSFLILDLDRSAADAIAQRFGQRAYVWLEKRRPPELALTLA